MMQKYTLNLSNGSIGFKNQVLAPNFGTTQIGMPPTPLQYP